jgi:uncharacterized GH25 family protein
MFSIKRTMTLLVTIFIFSIAMGGVALSHTFWVLAEDVKPGEKPTIVNGYSDHFPKAETIEEKRLSFILPPSLIAPDGKKIALTLSEKDNYIYQASEPAQKGTYLVLGEYAPTIWTLSKEGGWEIKPKNEVKGEILESSSTANFAKFVYNVGGAADTDLITKPVGQKIELIPQSNPGALKVGEKFRLQLLFNGKPLANQPVYGVADGYGGDLHNIKGFMNTTDRNGYVDFVPWKSGFWNLEVNYGVPTKDDKTHDVDYWNAKFTLLVK